jgi:hypothetical protein
VNVLVIVPAYTHLDHRLTMALLEAQLPLLPLFGSSDLPRARSILISHALRQATERVLFIDADVVPTPEQLIALATSPHVTPEQALTGLYPIRDVRSTPGAGAAWAVDAVDPATAPGKATFEANWAGLGFAAVHVDSLRRVAERLPEIEGDEVPWKPFCVPRVEGGVYYPDDRVLWWRLAKTGTSLLADASLKVGHVASVVLRDAL